MLRHIKPGMLVFSVLYILLGLLLLLAPQAVADVFCIALGLLVVLCGLQSLYGYFKKDNGSIRAAVSLLLSLPTIALGMWALLCTVQSAMTFEWLLPLLFGLMLLVDGVVRAQSSFALAKRKGQKWWLLLLLSLVSVALGVVLVLHPFDAAIGVTMLCGILLIVEGALNLGCVLYAAMELRTLDRMANAAASAAMSAIGDALDEAEAAESGIPMDGPVVYNAESKDVSDEE